MGVGLRLSAQAAEALAASAPERAWLSAFLERESLYVFTLNGFPYGAFHGVRVKAAVYQPDWLHPARLSYANHLADILASLLPAGMDGSISTVPGGFRDLRHTPDAEEAVAEALLRHMAHLVALRARTGASIALALEPEPMCFLETTEEAAAFLERRLFSRAAIARLAALTGLGAGAAEEAARRHLGLCYDVCHAAVEFEDPVEGLARLRGAGIAVPKLQLSAALRIPRADAAARAALARFDDGVYLHQVVTRRGDGRLTRHLDLADAFATPVDAGEEWRVHLHVPVFRDSAGPFATTQDTLRAVLRLQRAAPVSAHLEVETYTWDVLPPELREDGIAPSIARELDWVRQELSA
jgi:hypothetical protein